jgi:hypothetical protein
VRGRSLRKWKLRCGGGLTRLMINRVP